MLFLQCEEMKELCSEEHLDWISRYLVLKRASIETNFHTLYSNFVDQIKLNKLADMVLKETYRNIGVRIMFGSVARMHLVFPDLLLKCESDSCRT